MDRATLRMTPISDELADADALADLAFGSMTRGYSSRSLAFLPAEDLQLDLSDPEQRNFGDYELIKVLGTGGMGVVYLARQHSLDREVALKLLAAGPWSSEAFIRRFQAEAQSAARLHHPNIVPIFEIGTFEELNFFSMRVVHGPTLADVLKRDGPMGAEQAAQLVKTIAEAVDYAHRMGVLHLDLKPGNVLIDERGEPLVADFGLARRLDRSSELASEEVSGTPSYMAPEQARPGRHPLSPLTDVYGLGAILYELLSGRPPYRGGSAQATLQHVVESRLPSLRELDPRIPADVVAACEHCLEKVPGDRYVSAGKLAEDLTRFLEGQPVSVRPLSAPERFARAARREPKVAAAAVAAVLILVVGLVATSMQWRRAETNAQAASELLWDSRRQAALRLTTEGRGFEAAALLAENLAEQTARSVPAASDRRRLGLLMNQAPVLIASGRLASVPTSVAVSPDGATVAVGALDGSVQWLGVPELEPLGRVDLRKPGAREPWLLQFADNDRLLVTRNWSGQIVASPPGFRMHLVELDAARVVPLPEPFGGVDNASFSANGRFALLQDSNGRSQLWELDPWRVRSPLIDKNKNPYKDTLPWQLDREGRFMVWGAIGGWAFNVFRVSGQSLESRFMQRPSVTHSGISAWSLSGSGQWLALGGYRGEVMLFNVEDGSQVLLPTPPGELVTWVEFSEDDTWLGTVNRDGTGMVFDVEVGVPLVSGRMTHPFEPRRIRVSRNRQLALVSGEGHAALWRLPEISGYPRRALPLPVNPEPWMSSSHYAIDWAPGTGLVAGAGEDGVLRLWRLPVSPMLPARAPRQMAASLHLEAGGLVDVSGNRLRLVSVADGSPLTDWLLLPQAPGFAELAGDGRTLVVSCGASLHVYDVAGAAITQRYAPLPLEASPMRMALHPAGDSVVLAFGHNTPYGFEERLVAYSLSTGKVINEPVSLPGPLRRVSYGNAARQLLVTGSNPERVDLLNDDMTHSARVLASPDRSIAAAELFGSRLAVVEYGMGGEGIHDELLIWDLQKNAVVGRQNLQVSEVHALAEFGGGIVALGAQRDWLGADQPDPRPLPAVSGERQVPTFSVAPNGQMLARAHRGSVQLYNPEGHLLGAPLEAEITGHDVIARLAFSPDGDRLVARTALGHWLSWSVQPATDSTVVLDDLQQRRVSRKPDPGPWPMPPSRPADSVAAVVWGRRTIPARHPSASPLLLDLTEHYTFAPDSRENEFMTPLMDLSGLPIGIQRIDGVNYDLRGAAMISLPDFADARRAPLPVYATGLKDIEVPRVPVAGFHVLLYVYLQTPEPDQRTLMHLRLNYVDGGEAMVPVKAQLHLPGGTAADHPVPVGWMLSTASTHAWDGYERPLSNPFLANPHPRRLVKSIDLVLMTEVFAVTAVVAITAEPMDPPMGDLR